MKNLNKSNFLSLSPGMKLRKKRVEKKIKMHSYKIPHYIISTKFPPPRVIQELNQSPPSEIVSIPFP